MYVCVLVTILSDFSSIRLAFGEEEATYLSKKCVLKLNIAQNLHSNILLATSQCFEKPFNNTRDYGVHVRKEIIPNTCTPKKVKKVDWGRTDKKKLLGCRGVNCVTLKWLCWLTNTVQNITNNSIGIHIERKIEIRYVSVLQCFFVLFSWNYYDVNNITKCKYGLT